MRALGTTLLLAFWISGCAGTPATKTVAVPSAAGTIRDHIIYSRTSWSGDVRLVEPVIVTRTGTLTLQPGTRIYFDLPDPAPNHERDPWVLVLGSLVALGTEEHPILFIDVQNRQNELDDMIQVQEAKEVHFRHCVFERGPWGLHIHGTSVDVTDCTFRSNYGGVRFQGGEVVLRGNRFEGNRIGVRCLSASPVIEQNAFVGNLTGVFFREGVQDAVLRSNNFDNREYDVKLGEGQVHDVAAPGNWWKAAEDAALQERIYDGQDSDGVGRVVVDSRLATPWTRTNP